MIFRVSCELHSGLGLIEFRRLNLFLCERRCPNFCCLPPVTLYNGVYTGIAFTYPIAIFWTQENNTLRAL